MFGAMQQVCWSSARLVLLRSCVWKRTLLCFHVMLQVGIGTRKEDEGEVPSWNVDIRLLCACYQRLDP